MQESFIFRHMDTIFSIIFVVVLLSIVVSFAFYGYLAYKGIEFLNSDSPAEHLGAIVRLFLDAAGGK